MRARASAHATGHTGRQTPPQQQAPQSPAQDETNNGPRQGSNGHAAAEAQTPLPANSNGHAAQHPKNASQDKQKTSEHKKKANPFSVTPKGVYFIEEETGARTYVCSPLKVAAYTRDADSESWGRLLVWTDRNGYEHKWAMPMNMLAGDGTALRETLLSGGVLIGTASRVRQLLLQYLQSANPGRSAVCVPQVGWYGRIFVLPDCAIPKAAADTTIYQTAARGEHFYRIAGTIEEWRDRIGRQCAGNSRLVLVVSMAFAAPLLRPMNVEGGGFHVIGPSTTGKSTCQWVAGSACGGGNDGHGFARSWRSTQNALEAMAELHNDGLLILDEMREIPEAKNLDQTVYMLSNGGGKSRMNKSMIAQRTLSWRMLFLSSGEIKLSEYAASAGTRIKAGAEVRLLNLPADSGAGMGVFEDIHGAESPRAFAEKLKSAAGKTYGTALRYFLDQLASNWDRECELVKASMEAFVTSSLPPTAAPEVGRALRRIALIAAAGERATAMGITGWPVGEARRAALRCFQDWIADRGGIGQADLEAGIRQVRAVLEADGSSRFQSVVTSNGIEEHVTNRLGYWREEDKERVFLVFPEAFRDQLCRGFDYRMIAKELHSRGLLLKADGNNLMRKERIPGFKRSIRVYAIGGRILSTDGDGDDDKETPTA